MTTDDVKKGLECCYKDDCTNCPYADIPEDNEPCSKKLLRHAKSEIRALEQGNKLLLETGSILIEHWYNEYKKGEKIIEALTGVKNGETETVD